MKKRIIAILLGCFLVLTLVGCGNSESSEIDNTSMQDEVSIVEVSGNVLVFKTKTVEEYLIFLETFDEASNEILGVTTSLNTGGRYTSAGFYMVTYRELVKQ